MKTKILIAFLIVPVMASAQMNYGRSTWFLKGNVSSLFDILTFPSVQISVEKQLSDYLSLSLEGGYQLYNFKRADTSFYNPRGFKGNIELRYYFTKFVSTRFAAKTGRSYLGFRPFYYQNRYNTSISYTLDPASGVWIDDDFGVKNRSFGINFIFGFQKAVNDWLLIDVYTGAGVNYREVSNTDLQYVDDAGYHMAGTKFIRLVKQLDLSETSGLKPNILVGLRAGFGL